MKLSGLSTEKRTDMKKSRFTIEQIIGFIRQVEAGMAVAELARQQMRAPTASS